MKVINFINFNHYFKKLDHKFQCFFPLIIDMKSKAPTNDLIVLHSLVTKYVWRDVYTTTKQSNWVIQLIRNSLHVLFLISFICQETYFKYKCHEIIYKFLFDIWCRLIL